MSGLVCCTKPPQHRSTMVQGFACTILVLPKSLVFCADHLMTRCFIAFTIARASLPPLDLDKTERIVDEAREKAHSCPIFWFRGLPPSDWFPKLPVAEDPFVEWTLARWTSWVVMKTQTGAEALRPKTPAFVVVGVVLLGSSPTVDSLNTLGRRAGILLGRNQ